MINFQDEIDKRIAQEASNFHKSSGKWKPSNFGKCYRQQYWSRLGEKETNPPDARTLRVFKVGNIFEGWVKGMLENHPGLRYQVLVEEEDVKGYADFVDEDSVADTKTMHSQGFHYLTKKDCDIREEKKPNWLQVMYYAWKLDKKFGKLGFFSKDDLCIFEIPQETKDWIKDLEEELKTLREYWNKKELPPAKPRCFKQKDGSYLECKYCGFSLHGKCKEV